MDRIYWVAVCCYMVWNIIVFALYGIDKYKSKRGKRRISEKTLITAAFLMGGIGAAIGMRAFRHKTKHVKFIVFISLAVIVNAAGIIALISMLFKNVE